MGGDAVKISKIETLACSMRRAFKASVKFCDLCQSAQSAKADLD